MVISDDYSFSHVLERQGNSIIHNLTKHVTDFSV